MAAPPGRTAPAGRSSSDARPARRGRPRARPPPGWPSGPGCRCARSGSSSPTWRRCWSRRIRRDDEILRVADGCGSTRTSRWPRGSAMFTGQRARILEQMTPTWRAARMHEPFSVRAHSAIRRRRWRWPRRSSRRFSRRAGGTRRDEAPAAARRPARDQHLVVLGVAAHRTRSRPGAGRGTPPRHLHRAARRGRIPLTAACRRGPPPGRDPARCRTASRTASQSRYAIEFARIVRIH